jgi:hypothetical protein
MCKILKPNVKCYGFNVLFVGTSNRLLGYMFFLVFLGNNVKLLLQTFLLPPLGDFPRML